MGGWEVGLFVMVVVVWFEEVDLGLVRGGE